MKKLAYLLLVAGFLFGAYLTSLDAVEVDWILFGSAAAAAAAGVVLAKRADAAHARSHSVLETNRNELNESLSNIVRDLQQMSAGEPLRGDALRGWIDATLRPDLRRFADARESMVHLYGLQTYADIMSEFAAGERYINRVWTSSADGYDGEAQAYLHRAAAQFDHARQQLTAAAA